MASSNPLIASSGPFPPEMQNAIALELDAILSDREFRTSQRNCAFLRYVTLETLAGRADEIKERTLGKELFGRPISYDTGSDAVVRVRANELRKRLICYYETHQSQAGWRLQLPLRTYVPAFIREDVPNREKTSAVNPHSAAARAPRPEAALPHPAAMTGGIGARDRALPVDLRPVLPVSRMMIPTLVALFLCIITLRFQASYGSPYLDFWEVILSNRTGIAVVLDADPSDPDAVTTSDLEMIRPILETATRFHETTVIASARADRMNQGALLAIHVTHRLLPGGDRSSAFITVVPGEQPQLWVASENSDALKSAIHSISDGGVFPKVLEAAVRRKTPTHIRFTESAQVLLPDPVRVEDPR